MISLSVGIYVLIAFLFPNFIYMNFKEVYKPELQPNKKLFNILEIVGRIGVMIFMTLNIWIFEISFKTDETFILWAILCLLLIVAYWALWIRFYVMGRYFEYLYDKVLINIPMAIIPCLLFIITGLLSLNIPLILFSIIFSVGHIMNSNNVYNQIKDEMIDVNLI